MNCAMLVTCKHLYFIDLQRAKYNPMLKKHRVLKQNYLS